MKIALVCPASIPAIQFGGPLTLFVDLARELAKLNNDVTIYTTDLDFANNISTFNKNLQRNEEYEGFRINRTHVYFAAYTFFVNLGMYRQLRIDKPDIIHTIGVRSFQSLVAALVAKRYKIPLVVSDQSGIATQPEEKKGSIVKRMLYKIQSPIVKFVIDQAIKISVPNEYEKKAFLKFCDDSKIIIIPNGISLESLYLRSTIHFKEKYSIDSDFILFVGRFTKIKGIDTLLQSFALIRNEPEIRKTKLVIMGVDFGFEVGMMKMIEDLDMANQVIVIKKPPRDDVISAYGESEFLVLPSRWELSPITPLEGLAFKKAVISTNAHGIPYTIRDGECCILVDPEDYHGLSKAMLELFRNREKRTQYGLNGYNLVNEVANSKSMAKSTLKMYQGITN